MHIGRSERLPTTLPALESPSQPPPPSGGEPAPEGSFERALRGLGARIDAGERLVGQALHGSSSLDAGELIALQAGIYRYAEAVDLAAKLVDRASNAVRTTLQAQG
jgi:hypothetical protein